MLLPGKTAIITGGASRLGIGLATGRLFGAHGARVALLDLDGGKARAAAAAIGPAHRGYACDVRDPERCRSVVATVAAELGAVDILVNNAGVVHGTAILDITPAEYDEVLDTNLRGQFHMARAVIPHLRARGSGVVICISSIAGQVGGGIFGTTHYAAAKSGIFGLAKGLARELAADGIRVNAIAPGTIDNDFSRGAMTPAHKQEIAARVPLGRLGRPEEIAGGCLFLASDLSSYMTGAVLDINGGLLMR